MLNPPSDAAVRLRICRKRGGLLWVDRGDGHAALDVFLLIAEAQENVPGWHLFGVEDG